jgi:hypothetical protein
VPIHKGGVGTLWDNCGAATDVVKWLTHGIRESVGPRWL